MAHHVVTFPMEMFAVMIFNQVSQHNQVKLSVFISLNHQNSIGKCGII
jgi:hypothetical protein